MGTRALRDRLQRLLGSMQQGGGAQASVPTLACVNHGIDVAIGRYTRHGYGGNNLHLIVGASQDAQAW